VPPVRPAGIGNPVGMMFANQATNNPAPNAPQMAGAGGGGDSSAGNPSAGSVPFLQRFLGQLFGGKCYFIIGVLVYESTDFA